jgi:hypothetical protein
MMLSEDGVRGIWLWVEERLMLTSTWLPLDFLEAKSFTFDSTLITFWPWRAFCEQPSQCS